MIAAAQTKDCGRIFTERLLGLRPGSLKQIAKLAAMYRESSDRGERGEIVAVADEIVNRDPGDLVATSIDDEKSPHAAAALAARRERIGREIKKRRQALKMSQEELAGKTGLPQTHISRLETGKHAPSYLTIEKVAKALRIKPAALDPTDAG